MELTHSGRQIVPLSNAKEWVPWCGLLVNPATMQVRVRSISLSTHALALIGPGVQSHIGASAKQSCWYIIARIARWYTDFPTGTTVSTVVMLDQVLCNVSMNLLKQQIVVASVYN